MYGIVVKLARVRLAHAVQLAVKARTLHEETPCDGAVGHLRLLRLLVLLRLKYSVVERHGIDWQLVFARIVLQRARDKGLREEEPADPVDVGRDSCFVPRAEELETLQQIVDPR